MKIADTSAPDEVLHQPRTKPRWLWPAAAIGGAALLLWLVLPALQSWSQSDISVPLSRVRVDTVKTADFTRDISAQGQDVAAGVCRTSSCALVSAIFISILLI